jgi:hypothetical protein
VALAALPTPFPAVHVAAAEDWWAGLAFAAGRLTARLPSGPWEHARTRTARAARLLWGACQHSWSASAILSALVSVRMCVQCWLR